jgi:hypothetical protein
VLLGSNKLYPQLEAKPSPANVAIASSRVPQNRRLWNRNVMYPLGFRQKHEGNMRILLRLQQAAQGQIGVPGATEL